MDHESFLREYEAALGSHTWEAVEPLIDEGACFVFSEGTYVGKAEIEKAFRKTFALIKDEIYRIEGVRWVYVHGDCALCAYTFHWAGVIEGQHHKGEGRGTSFLARSGGKWSIKHEHLGPPAG